MLKTKHIMAKIFLFAEVNEITSYGPCNILNTITKL